MSNKGPLVPLIHPWKAHCWSLSLAELQPKLFLNVGNYLAVASRITLWSRMERW